MSHRTSCVLALAGFLVTLVGRPAPATACLTLVCMEPPAFRGETLPAGVRKIPLPLDIFQMSKTFDIQQDGRPVPGRVEHAGETPLFVPEAPLADGRYEFVVDPRNPSCSHVMADPLTFEVGGSSTPRPTQTGTLSVVKAFVPAAPGDSCSSWSDTAKATVFLALPEAMSSWKALTRIHVEVLEAPSETTRRSFDINPTLATSEGRTFSAECTGTALGKYTLRYTAGLVDEDVSLEPAEISFDLECPAASRNASGDGADPEGGPAESNASCSLAAPLGAPSWSPLVALLSAVAVTASRRRRRLATST